MFTMGANNILILDFSLNCFFFTVTSLGNKLELNKFEFSLIHTVKKLDFTH